MSALAITAYAIIAVVLLWPVVYPLIRRRFSRPPTLPPVEQVASVGEGGHR